MIANLVGRGLYYIVVAVAVVGVINLPIQITQLVLLTSLKFPEIHLPIQIPWYVTIIGCVVSMLFALLLLGILFARLKIIEHQNTVANENNLQVIEILERLDRIERCLHDTQ